MLDEECNFPKGTDQTFLDKICQKYAKEASFKKSLKVQDAFIIVHYAGEVN